MAAGSWHRFDPPEMVDHGSDGLDRAVAHFLVARIWGVRVVDFFKDFEDEGESVQAPVDCVGQMFGRHVVNRDTRIGFSLSNDKEKDLRDPGRWLGYGAWMPSSRSTAIVHALLARIVVARKSMGMSQETLAELSKVDLGVISRAERLQRIPGMASILDMALALNLDVAALVKSAIRDAGREEKPQI